MNKQERKEYKKKWLEEHKEEAKAYYKAYRQAHKEEIKAYKKAWHAANKESEKAKMKAWNTAHKEEFKAYQKSWNAANKDKRIAYMKSDVNCLGQTKASIRQKSWQILKQMNLKIPGYEIHHCFGYEDASKFIYISKSLHLKIHQYLRDNNIEADSDHWMQIRDIVNSTDEFMYIKC